MPSFLSLRRVSVKEAPSQSNETAIEALESRLIEAYEDALHDGLHPKEALVIVARWIAIEGARHKGGCRSGSD